MFANKVIFPSVIGLTALVTFAGSSILNNILSFSADTTGTSVSSNGAAGTPQPDQTNGGYIRAESINATSTEAGMSNMSTLYPNSFVQSN